MVYSGDVSRSHEFLASVGRACPPGFNLADYLSECCKTTLALPFLTPFHLLVDITTEAELDRGGEEFGLTESSSVEDRSNLADEERGLVSHSSSSQRPTSNGYLPEGNGANGTRKPSSIASGSSQFVKRKASQLLKAVVGEQPADVPLSQKLSELVDAYASSDIASSIWVEMESLSRGGGTNGGLPDVAEEGRHLRGRRGASWLTQFRILSGRAFKNLYRDPALLTAHYILSIALAGE